MFDALVPWIEEHRLFLAVLTSISVLLLAATLIATPWLIAQLPADYFHTDRGNVRHRGPGKIAVLIVRNTAGVLFMLVGILMMITPGPGLVCLLLGLSLCEFRGKHDMLRRLAGQPNVFASLNWMRRKAEKPAFLHPMEQ